MLLNLRNQIIKKRESFIKVKNKHISKAGKKVKQKEIKKVNKFFYIVRLDLSKASWPLNMD